MAAQPRFTERFFKTAWFDNAARKARIGDEELCAAMRQVLLGLADDLGGGVYKKRLSKNLYRSIIVARGGRYWIYTFLFAKQDKANIDSKELSGFRDFATLCSHKTEEEISEELQCNELMEICDGKKKI